MLPTLSKVVVGIPGEAPPNDGAGDEKVGSGMANDGLGDGGVAAAGGIGGITLTGAAAGGSRCVLCTPRSISLNVADGAIASVAGGGMGGSGMVGGMGVNVGLCSGGFSSGRGGKSESSGKLDGNELSVPLRWPFCSLGGVIVGPTDCVCSGSRSSNGSLGSTCGKLMASSDGKPVGVAAAVI